jgi:hypothetical protein
MIKPRAIVGSALATAIINILGALLIIAALTPETPRLNHQNLQGSSHLYRLSPIPAGADWDH